MRRAGVEIAHDGSSWSCDVRRLPSDFEARLRAIGAERYHHRHPFNLRMHAGTLTRDGAASWVANRYYYQTRIPLKDEPDPREVRRSRVPPRLDRADP